MNAKGERGHSWAPGPLPAHTTPMHDGHLSILLPTTCQLPSLQTQGKALALAEGANISRSSSRKGHDTQLRHYNDFAVLKATLGSAAQLSPASGRSLPAPTAALALALVCVWTGTAASSSPGSLTSSTSLFVKEKFQWVHPTHGTQVQIYIYPAHCQGDHMPRESLQMCSKTESLCGRPVPQSQRESDRQVPRPRPQEAASASTF